MKGGGESDVRYLESIFRPDDCSPLQQPVHLFSRVVLSLSVALFLSLVGAVVPRTGVTSILEIHSSNLGYPYRFLFFSYFWLSFLFLVPIRAMKATVSLTPFSFDVIWIIRIRILCWSIGH
jgi:hypothetical protein